MDWSNLISMAPEIGQACLETGLMLSIGLCAALLLGGPLGIVLFLTQPGQLWANRALNGVLGWSVNLVRSFPFIILMVSLVPLTRLLVGSTIGPVAAAVPLSFAAIPYFARLVEQTLREVPRGVLEAAEAMGASPWLDVWPMPATSRVTGQASATIADPASTSRRIATSIERSTVARRSAISPACHASATRGASVVAVVTATSAWGST